MCPEATRCSSAPGRPDPCPCAGTATEPGFCGCECSSGGASRWVLPETFFPPQAERHRQAAMTKSRLFKLRILRLLGFHDRPNPVGRDGKGTVKAHLHERPVFGARLREGRKSEPLSIQRERRHRFPAEPEALALKRDGPRTVQRHTHVPPQKARDEPGLKAVGVQEFQTQVAEPHAIPRRAVFAGRNPGTPPRKVSGSPDRRPARRRARANRSACGAPPSSRTALRARARRSARRSRRS